MIRVVLYQPEIAPNTGNIIRLCANCGAALHLIRPLGFELDDRRLRRAGLDYAEWSRIETHDSYQAFLNSYTPEAVYAFTTKGERRHTQVNYRRGDVLLFGPETRGLSSDLRERATSTVRIPMLEGSRSMNLSNSVAVACYEVWRQLGFEDAQ